MADPLVALIQMAPSLAKLATDLVSTTDTTKRNAQLIEFQNALIGLQSLIASVQQENATLIQLKRDAEEELKRMKNWETEKQRYKLASPFSGAFVYALQKAMCNGEPPHYICTNCLQRAEKSILQIAADKDGWTMFVCPVCKSAARTGSQGAEDPEYAEYIEQQT